MPKNIRYPPFETMQEMGILELKETFQCASYEMSTLLGEFVLLITKLAVSPPDDIVALYTSRIRGEQLLFAIAELFPHLLNISCVTSDIAEELLQKIIEEDHLNDT